MLPIVALSPTESRAALVEDRQARRQADAAQQRSSEASTKAPVIEREAVAKRLIAEEEADMRSVKQGREATARSLIERDEAAATALKIQREIIATALLEKEERQTSSRHTTLQRQMTARALLAKDKADMRTIQTERESEARALIAKEESAMRALTADRETAARAIIEVQEARQLSAVARESRRQQALFIDTMCHEIRNPINGILGSVNIARDHIVSIEHQLQEGERSLEKSLFDCITQLRDTITDIEECAHHQRIIADDVLAFSKLEQSQVRLVKTPMNLTHVLRQMLRPYELICISKKIRMEVSLFNGAGVHILGDTNRLKQIIGNLLDNAVKFTATGFIKVTALTHGMDEDHDEVFEINIEDSGIGLTTEEADSLFVPYSQANQSISSKYGGTGLGLVVSQELAKLMKGHIGVRSEKGVGTEFKLRFAATTIAADAYVMTSTPTATVSPLGLSLASASTAQRVLVVEDNRINQKILVNMLTKAGYMPDIADDGVQALRLYNLYTYKIILMDIQMPVMDGLEATRRIRTLEGENHLPAAYIICVTGNAREELKAEALSCGVNDYLIKPINRDVLLTLLQKITKNGEQSTTEVDCGI